MTGIKVVDLLTTVIGSSKQPWCVYLGTVGGNDDGKCSGSDGDNGKRSGSGNGSDIDDGKRSDGDNGIDDGKRSGSDGDNGKRSGSGNDDSEHSGNGSDNDDGKRSGSDGDNGNDGGKRTRNKTFPKKEKEHSRHHWDTWFSQGYDKHSGSNKVKQSGRWTWLNWFVPAVISIVGMWVSYGIVSKEWCVKRVADGIKSSKIPEVDKEEPFLERKELIETLKKYFDRMKWNTVVITGTRGSAKAMTNTVAVTKSNRVAVGLG